MIKRTSGINGARSESALQFSSGAIHGQTGNLESSERLIQLWWKKGRAWIIYKIQLLQFQDQVKNERQALQSLSDEELRDIGICRADADQESRRSISDTPTDRRDAPRIQY